MMYNPRPGILPARQTVSVSAPSLPTVSLPPAPSITVDANGNPVSTVAITDASGNPLPQAVVQTPNGAAPSVVVQAPVASPSYPGGHIWGLVISAGVVGFAAFAGSYFGAKAAVKKAA